jgi:hypothetical protein
MSAIAKSSQYLGGHPLWHLLIVAGGAIAVFIAIKAKESWDRQFQPRRANRAARALNPTPTYALASWQLAKLPMLGLAVLSITSAAIHASVSSEHFQEAFIFGVFFLVASTAQAGWAVLLLYRPSRMLVIVAAAGNAAIIALWTTSRTIGLPIGPKPWQPETIGTRDIIATLCELFLVLGATILLARDFAITRSDVIERPLEGLGRRHPAIVRTPRS